MATKDQILQKYRANVRERHPMPDLSDIAAITYADPLRQFIAMTETVGGRVVELPSSEEKPNPRVPSSEEKPNPQVPSSEEKPNPRVPSSEEKPNLRVPSSEEKPSPRVPSSEEEGSGVVATKAEETAAEEPGVVASSLAPLIRSLYPDAREIASNLPEAADIATRNPDTVASAQDLNGTDVGIVRGAFGVAENGCIWVPQQMVQKAVCFISENLVILLPKSQIVNNMHEAYRRLRTDFPTTQPYGTFISGPSKTADIAQVLVMGAQAARSVTVVLMQE